MTTRRSSDDRITRWLLDTAPGELPDRVLESTFDRTRSTSQVSRGRLWRERLMRPHPILFATGAVAIAVIAVVTVGGSGLGPNQGGVGSEPTPSPSPRPRAVSSPAPSAVSTGDWVPFSSSRYHYEMSIPPDWTSTQSTRTWALATDQTDWLSPAADGFRPPNWTVYVSAFAAPMDPGQSGAEWIATYQGPDAKGIPNECAPEPVDLGMPTVDGHPVTFTRAVLSCGETQAFVPIGDTMYVFSVWIDGQEELLKAFLSTVRFRPWIAYSSSRYAFTIGHPADWTVNPADHVWTFDGDSHDRVSTGYESFVSPDGQVRVSAWSVPRTPAEGTMWADTAPDSWRKVEPWVKAYCERTGTTPCSGIHERAVPLCLEKRDCHPGLLVPFQDSIQAFFTNGAEGAPMTIVAIWRGPTDPNAARYGGSRNLVEAFLSTMGVQPAEASPFEESRAAAGLYKSTSP